MDTFGDVRSEVIELKDLSERDRSEWRALATRAIEPNPFHEPEYLLPLARGLGAESSVGLVVARDATGWLACLPARAGRWHRIPLRSVATWRSRYSFLGTPLVAPDRSVEAVAALVSGMLAGSPSFAALDWGTPAMDALASSSHASGS